MIPKIIHYCWFGKNPKTKLAMKCIKSWREKCKDYTIIEWNEENFDISKCPLYVRQAYELKKWAFVTDYVRLLVVYENGGIYFDTDVQVIKSFDNLLLCNSFFGFENAEYVATGLGFGAEKGAQIIKELLEQYIDILFVQPDGTIDDLPCPQRNTEVFVKNGLILNNKLQYLFNGTVVYPSEYFCPLKWNGKMKLTKNSMSIHWFAESWHDHAEDRLKKKQRKKQKYHEKIDIIKHLPNNIAMKLLGESTYERIKKTKAIKHTR